MMRRIDLLPGHYAQRRRERRNFAAVIVAGLVVLLLLIGWWFWYGLQINDAEDRLAEVQADNQRLEAEIAELQRFAELAATVEAKETALQTVFAGDLDWPAIMTEVAMVIPGDVWLTSMSLSAANVEGATQVPTQTAPIPISDKENFGSISFQGQALSMPAVAKWLIRLDSVREFFASYLNNAAGAVEDTGGVGIVTFDSTIELSDRATSQRFQRETTP